MATLKDRLRDILDNRIRATARRVMNTPLPQSLQAPTRTLNQTTRAVEKHPWIGAPVRMVKGRGEAQAKLLTSSAQDFSQGKPVQGALKAVGFGLSLTPPGAGSAALMGGLSALGAPPGDRARAFGEGTMYASIFGKGSQITNPFIYKAITGMGLGQKTGFVASRAVPALANVAQGIGLDRTAGTPTTPTSIGIDLAAGLVGGRGSFASSGAIRGAKAVKPRLTMKGNDPGELTQMYNAIRKMNLDEMVSDRLGMVKNFNDTASHYLKKLGFKATQISKMTEAEKWRILSPHVQENVMYRVGDVPVMGITQKKTLPISTKQLLDQIDQSIESQSLPLTKSIAEQDYYDSILKQARNQVNNETRSAFTKAGIDAINRVKSMARSRKFVEGDVETLRAKNSKAVEEAIEAVRETTGITDDSEALAYALSLPTAKNSLVSVPKTKEFMRVYVGKPTSETLKKIKLRDIKAQEITAKQDYAQWLRALRSQEGLLTERQLVDKATGSLSKQRSAASSDSVVEKMNDIHGFSAQMRDLHRNFKRAYGGAYDIVKKTVLDPFDDSKKQFVVSQEKWLDELDNNVVKKLGINKKSKESRLVQLYGEGQISLEDLKKETPKWREVVEADQWFRKAYDQLLDEVNEVRRRIYPNDPKKIIPKRKDYYRHFREVAQGFEGLKNIFDTPSNIASPLAGVSQRTRPKSKWLSFAQERLGSITDEDAVGGFLDYLKGATYAKYIDPQIVTFRALRDELAMATESGANKGKINNFLEYLDDFANDLAGKTNALDRYAQKVTGRRVFSALNWLNSRVKANVILGNLSSSVAQIFNVPQGIAEVGPKYAYAGLGKTLSGLFEQNKAMAESGFIKERYFNAYDKFDRGMVNDVKKGAAWLTSVLDEIGTKYIWNSAYEKALAENISDPVRYADGVARGMVAGRGIGEVPLAQKAKLFQLVAPFQLEVANLWWVMKDWVDDKTFGKFATFVIASHVFNKAAESIRGSGVSLDPLEAAIDAMETYQNEEDKKVGAIRATGRIAGEALSNLPFGQTFASMYPEYGVGIPGTDEKLTRKEFFGREDPTRFGSGLLAAKGLEDPLFKIAPPFGGQQIKRTLEGLMTNVRGYSESNAGRVRPFEVEDNIGRNVQRLLFGQYSTPNAREYFNEGRAVMGDKQSELFKSLPREQRSEMIKSLISSRESEKKLDKSKEIARSTGSSNTEKIYHYLDDDGSVKTIDIGKVLSMPENNAINRAKKDKEVWKTADDILNSNLAPNLQAQALQKLGVDIEQAEYYNIAKETNDLKYLYIEEEINKIISTTKNREDVLKFLVKQRQEVGGKVILSSGVIDDLRKAGYISKAEADKLKNITFDGKTKIPQVSVSGRGGGATLKSIKLTAPKMGSIRGKIPSLAQTKITPPSAKDPFGIKQFNPQDVVRQFSKQVQASQEAVARIRPISRSSFNI